jgi:hypothetical protein
VQIELSHKELSLVLFALQGGDMPNVPQDPCDADEAACPIAEDLKDKFGLRELSPEQKLAQHLSKHLEQGWVECGLLDLAVHAEQSPDRVTLIAMQRQLEGWSCNVRLEGADQQLLYEAIAKLPRSAWLSQPGTLWRLRKKLKPR